MPVKRATAGSNFAVVSIEQLARVHTLLRLWPAAYKRAEIAMGLGLHPIGGVPFKS